MIKVVTKNNQRPTLTGSTFSSVRKFFIRTEDDGENNNCNNINLVLYNVMFLDENLFFPNHLHCAKCIDSRLRRFKKFPFFSKSYDYRS